MISNVRFYRGVIAPSKEDAIEKGLTLKNPGRGIHDHLQPRKPSGGFFSYGELDGPPQSAEYWAKKVPRNEGQVAVVIDMVLNKDNFAILQGRVRSVVTRQWADYNEYVLIRNFEDFEKYPTKAILNLEGLSHGDLITLGVQVGFMSEGGNFDYKPYQEWANILGVHAPTREEILRSEGKPPQWRK